MDWCQGMLLSKIPVAEKDFMFSAISEEFGLTFSILALFLVCLNNSLMTEYSFKMCTHFLSSQL